MMTPKQLLQQMTDEAEARTAEAQHSTRLAEELRAMAPADRTAWLAAATPAQLRRAAEAFAAQAGSIVDYVEAMEAALVAKQADARAAIQAAGLTPLVLPSAALLETAADELLTIAAAAGDLRTVNALRKAVVDLATAPAPVACAGAWLVTSATRDGKVHSVRKLGGVWTCSCEAGGRGFTCRHVERFAIVEHAWDLLRDQDGGDDEPPAPTPAPTDGDDDGDAGDAAHVSTPATVLVTTYEVVTLGARLARARMARTA